MNCFLIKFPNTKDVSYGASENIIEGLNPGFFFAPFDNASQILTIPSDKETLVEQEYFISKLSDWIAENDTEYFNNHPEIPEPTSKAEHIAYVSAAIKKIKLLEKQSKNNCKIVAARIKLSPFSGSIYDSFLNLCDFYPNACIFLFSTPTSGTWIGASPELLLKTEESQFHSMALAGTRPSGSSSAWDNKNLDEQRIVTDYIASAFLKEDLEPSIIGPQTRNFGKIEHLATQISAEVNESNEGNIKCTFFNLLNDLSPTPALCGYPKLDTLNFILQKEKFDRNYYGGYFGLFKEPDNLIAFVNLRSAMLNTPKDIAIRYAGGGITRDSEPEKEWEETETKLSTLIL